MTHLLHVLQTLSSLLDYIYSIDTILYPYVLPLIYFLFSFLKSLLKYNLSSKLSVKIKEDGLDLFYFSFHFLFSIFRITRVRVN